MNSAGGVTQDALHELSGKQRNGKSLRRQENEGRVLIAKGNVMKSEKRTITIRQGQLLTAKGAARFFRLTKRAWLSLCSEELVPAAVRVDGVEYWRRGELRRWCLALGPSRAQWELLKSLAALELIPCD